mmetsp:Transcript_58077/g.173330  ORF Transcript_58077/g.173330 Transcript_58077/m.173330 type:complete len:205 (-) Transcript_58077:23-637(-)
MMNQRAIRRAMNGPATHAALTCCKVVKASLAAVAVDDRVAKLACRRHFFAIFTFGGHLEQDRAGFVHPLGDIHHPARMRRSFDVVYPAPHTFRRHRLRRGADEIHLLPIDIRISPSIPRSTLLAPRLNRAEVLPKDVTVYLDLGSFGAEPPVPVKAVTIVINAASVATGRLGIAGDAGNLDEYGAVRGQRQQREHDQLKRSNED